MDELEKYTESFFLQPPQDPDYLSAEHSEPTINGNSFMLLDQLLKARRRHLDDNNGISASSLV